MKSKIITGLVGASLLLGGLTACGTKTASVPPEATASDAPVSAPNGADLNAPYLKALADAGIAVNSTDAAKVTLGTNVCLARDLGSTEAEIRSLLSTETGLDAKSVNVVYTAAVDTYCNWNE